MFRVHENVVFPPQQHAARERAVLALPTSVDILCGNSSTGELRESTRHTPEGKLARVRRGARSRAARHPRPPASRSATWLRPEVKQCCRTLVVVAPQESACARQRAPRRRPVRPEAAAACLPGAQSVLRHCYCCCGTAWHCNVVAMRARLSGVTLESRCRHHGDRHGEAP